MTIFGDMFHSLMDARKSVAVAADKYNLAQAGLYPKADPSKSLTVPSLEQQKQQFMQQDPLLNKLTQIKQMSEVTKSKAAVPWNDQTQKWLKPLMQDYLNKRAPLEGLPQDKGQVSIQNVPLVGDVAITGERSGYIASLSDDVLQSTYESLDLDTRRNLTGIEYQPKKQWEPEKAEGLTFEKAEPYQEIPEWLKQRREVAAEGMQDYQAPVQNERANHIIRRELEGFIEGKTPYIPLPTDWMDKASINMGMKNYVSDAMVDQVWNDMDASWKFQISPSDTALELDQTAFYGAAERQFTMDMFNLNVAPKPTFMMTTKELNAEMEKLVTIADTRVPILGDIPLVGIIPNAIAKDIEAQKLYEWGTPDRRLYERQVTKSTMKGLAQGITIGVSGKFGYQPTSPEYFPEIPGQEVGYGSGLLVGSFIGYSGLAKMVRPLLLKSPQLLAMSKSHKLLFNTIVQNAGEEVVEIGIRKGTYQPYTVYDFMAGMAIGSMFEVGSFAFGKMKTKWNANRARMMDALETRLEIETYKKGAKLNDAEVTAVVKDVPFSKDTMLGDLFYESQLAYLLNMKKLHPQKVEVKGAFIDRAKGVASDVYHTFDLKDYSEVKMLKSKEATHIDLDKLDQKMQQKYYEDAIDPNLFRNLNSVKAYRKFLDTRFPDEGFLAKKGKKFQISNKEIQTTFDNYINTVARLGEKLDHTKVKTVMVGSDIFSQMGAKMNMNVNKIKNYWKNRKALKEVGEIDEIGEFLVEAMKSRKADPFGIRDLYIDKIGYLAKRGYSTFSEFNQKLKDFDFATDYLKKYIGDDFIKRGYATPEGFLDLVESKGYDLNKLKESFSSDPIRPLKPGEGQMVNKIENDIVKAVKKKAFDAMQVAEQSVEVKAEQKGDIDPLEPSPEMKEKIESDKIFLDDQLKKIKDYDQKMKKGERNFGKDKFRLNQKQANSLNNLTQTLGLRSYIVQTFKDINDAAFELGTDPKGLLKNLDTIRISAGEVQALKIQIRSQVKVVADLEIKLQQKGLTKIEKAEMIEKFDTAQDFLNNALEKYLKGGTEAGRAVVAYRMMAEETFDPAYWFSRARKEYGKTLTQKIQLDLTELIKKKDGAALAQYTASLYNPTWAEKGVALWKAGLLTSPTTHMANIMSTTGMITLETIKDIPATMLDITISKVMGTPRTKAFTVQRLKAMWDGKDMGFKEAIEYMESGIDRGAIRKWDLRRETNYDSTGRNVVGQFANKYTQTIFRSLGAEDKFMKAPVRQGSLMESAIVTAINEGLTGVKKKARIKQLYEKPTLEAQQMAKNTAEMASFQGENVLAKGISGLKKGLGGTKSGEIMGVASEVMMPFTRTPTNVAIAIADYSPFGLIHTIINQIEPTTRGQKRLVEDLGRQITGTGIVVLGAVLAGKGVMTGTFPTDTTERALWQLEGKQAHAVKIGDKWINLNRISPIGNLLAMGADWYNTKDEEALDRLGITGLQTMKGLTEQTFLKGVSGGLKAITEPERYAAAFVEQTVASIIPSIIGRIAGGVDPQVRDPRNIQEAVLKRIPGLSQYVGKRFKRSGEPMIREGGLIGAVADPFNLRRITETPLTDEVRRLWEAGYSAVPSKFAEIQSMEGISIQLSNDQYDWINPKIYTAMNEIQNRVLNMKQYDQLTDYQKKKALKDVEQQVETYYKTIFFTQMIQTHPELKVVQIAKEKKLNEKQYKDYLKQLLDKGQLDKKEYNFLKSRVTYTLK